MNNVVSTKEVKSRNKEEMVGAKRVQACRNPKYQTR